MSQTQRTQPADWAAELIDVFHAQRSLINELKPLAERQRALIEAGHTDALLELLGERQRIIDRFVEMDQDLARLTGDLPQRLQAVPEQRRGEIQALAAEIDEGIQLVLQHDEADQVQLKAARDRTRGQLATLSAARTARNAYLRPNAATNRFADQQG